MVGRTLGKWPRLLVAGAPVTAEQADEVLIRTNCWHLATNDRDFEKVVAELAGISIGDHGMVDWRSVRRFEQRHQVLDLRYLQNSRVCSAWVGGAHGWLEWDGTVGCSTWNIGRWPEASRVTRDWMLIAQAFPFLELTAQLVADEGAADVPAVQWRVHDGHVDLDAAPTEFIRPTQEIDLRDAVTSISRGDPFRERGVGRERLEQALQRVRAKFADDADATP